jgi:hypothetical protein
MPCCTRLCRFRCRMVSDCAGRYRGIRANNEQTRQATILARPCLSHGLGHRRKITGGGSRRWRGRRADRLSACYAPAAYLASTCDVPAPPMTRSGMRQLTWRIERVERHAPSHHYPGIGAASRLSPAVPRLCAVTVVAHGHRVGLEGVGELSCAWARSNASGRTPPSRTIAAAASR